MPVYYGDGGTNRQASTLAYNDGTNRTIVEAWFGDGIANRLVFTAMSASASPGVASSATSSPSQNTGNVTTTVTGGSGSFTHAWAKTSGGAITANAAASATTSFNAAGLGIGEQRVATFIDTVTDSVYGTVAVTNTVTVTIERI